MDQAIRFLTADDGVKLAYAVSNEQNVVTICPVVARTWPESS
jgi:hypothetical protein